MSLNEISQYFNQEEDLCPTSKQQVIDKRWSTKQNLEKMEKYSQPANCDKLCVPRVNVEIWDDFGNKTKHDDFRTTSILNSMPKVWAIIALSTEKMPQKKLPEVDKKSQVREVEFRCCSKFCKFCNAILSNLRSVPEVFLS